METWNIILDLRLYTLALCFLSKYLGESIGWVWGKECQYLVPHYDDLSFSDASLIVWQWFWLVYLWKQTKYFVWTQVTWIIHIVITFDFFLALSFHVYMSYCDIQFQKYKYISQYIKGNYLLFLQHSFFLQSSYLYVVYLRTSFP
jgi:hypothetical protein